MERMPAAFAGAASHGHLLDLIHTAEGLSRQQLLAATGMSRATLYDRLGALMRRGLIYEAEALEATGGRRSRKIRFDDRGRVVLAFALGHTHATVSVVDTAGRQLRIESHSHTISDPADTVLTPLLNLGQSMLDAGSGEVLTGVGLSLPSPVEAETGHVVHATTIPDWPADAVVAALSERWSVPFVVENDARAAALGERQNNRETIVYVKAATGVGCGIVVDGAILHGSRGAAGDIGHIQMAASGPLCKCGRRGCLATFSSGAALIDRLSTHGYSTIEEIGVAARRGEPVVLETLRSAADVLGRALAPTVTTINPDRLVLGGGIGALPVVVEEVRRRVLADVVERIADGLAIESAAAGGESAAKGLATLVMRKVFAPGAIDALFREAALA
jgi:predicted NBD/HSP70 family sugar kinase